jgi:energy-converting hydrogenase Eha subunit A
MDLIERYTYAILRKLPPDQRPSAEQDLRQRIAEAISQAESEGQIQPKATITALTRLGRPSKQAARLLGHEQRLIGPELFDLYTLILRIVLLAVSLGLVVALVVELLTVANSDPLRTAFTAIARIPAGLIATFGWITLIFAAIDRFGQDKIKIPPEDLFDPNDLPPVPEKEDRIKHSDPISTIIFTFIALIFVFLAPVYLGFYSGSLDRANLIPLFQADTYALFLPFMVLVLALGLVLEFLKLYTGRWTVALLGLSLALKIPGLVLTIFMFSHPGLFNPAFFQAMLELGGQVDPMTLGLALPQFISRTIIVLAVLGFAVDFLTTLWKVFRRVAG